MTTKTGAAIAPSPFTHATLGRTGRDVLRLGIASSFGLGAAGVEEAIERGVNYVYWGSLRKDSFGEGIRAACARDGGRVRDRVVLVIQSYTRLACFLGPSLKRALRRLRLDHADVLLLGWWNGPPPARIMDAARRLQEQGLVRHLALSTHERPLVASLAAPEHGLDLFHVRYNAAHRGAEREIFAHLADEPAARPGIVAFTALRWGSLLEPAAGDPPGARLPAPADCYRFALSNPKVDVVMTGPRDVADLRHALTGLERGPLAPDEAAWLKAHGDRVHAASKRGVRGLLWRGPAAT